MVYAFSKHFFVYCAVSGFSGPLSANCSLRRKDYVKSIRRVTRLLETWSKRKPVRYGNRKIVFSNEYAISS